MTTTSDGNQLLCSLPPSIICYSVCPFLNAFDVLAFRETCSTAFHTLHNQAESQDLWKQMLVRDFGFVCQDAGDECWKYTLRISPPNPKSPSIYGVDPSSSDVVEQVETTFDSWKRWMKANNRFHTDQNGKMTQHRFLHAPYFLRAAIFWKSIFMWCRNHGQVGKRIENSLKQKRGMTYLNWRKKLRKKPGVRAAQAVYAFCGGQEITSPDDLDGLFGGYQLEDHCTNSYFVSPNLELGNNLLMIAQCLASDHYGLPKMFAVDTDTGGMVLVTLTDNYRAVRIYEKPKEDEMLLWLEEYACQLQKRDIEVGITGSYDNGDAKGIPLFPTIRGKRPSITPPPSKSRLMMFPNIPLCSRTVTCGVEVIASAVYAAQAFHTFGYIYSIQLRLLPRHHEDYVSSKDRGFRTCQLLACKMQMTDFETQSVRHVLCGGIGDMCPLYPILSEDGHIEETAKVGPFQCQMSTGIRGPARGILQGTLQFVAGSIDAPTGPPFDVTIDAFLLDNKPDYFYYMVLGPFFTRLLALRILLSIYSKYSASTLPRS
jgi:hypothetical protein